MCMYVDQEIWYNDICSYMFCVFCIMFSISGGGGGVAEKGIGSMTLNHEYSYHNYDSALTPTLATS